MTQPTRRPHRRCQAIRTSAFDDRDSSDTDVKAAFKRVSRGYLAVRDDLEHSDRREARDDLKPVTDAYLDLESEVGGYPVRRASAED
jgi:hypothetical protein